MIKGRVDPDGGNRVGLSGETTKRAHGERKRENVVRLRGAVASVSQWKRVL